MYYIATMPMEKMIKIFKGVAIGCLKSKSGYIKILNVKKSQLSICDDQS